MSLPNQSPPSQQPSGAWTIALIIIAAAGVMMLVCCGGLAFLGALVYTRAEQAAAQAQTALQQGRAAAASAPAWQREWIAMSQLMPAYSAAIDAVASDKSVQEKLGEPIEPTGDAESLFRRPKKGDWTGADEMIEFDIKGPKGEAVVRATATMLPGRPQPQVGMRPSTILVVLADGTEISVPPPTMNDAP